MKNNFALLARSLLVLCVLLISPADAMEHEGEGKAVFARFVQEREAKTAALRGAKNFRVWATHEVERAHKSAAFGAYANLPWRLVASRLQMYEDAINILTDAENKEDEAEDKLLIAEAAYTEKVPHHIRLERAEEALKKAEEFRAESAERAERAVTLYERAVTRNFTEKALKAAEAALAEEDEAEAALERAIDELQAIEEELLEEEAPPQTQGLGLTIP